MRAFEYHAPASLHEAHELLSRYGEDAKLIAGGTGLVIFMKQRLVQPARVVSLRTVPGLDRIAHVNGALSIGAMTTHRAMERSAAVREAASILAETYSHVATVRIREAATVGGGLAHADPTQDTPLAFLVLDASVRLTASRGERTVPLDGFFQDHYTTIIAPDEVLTEVVVPRPAAPTGCAFLKFLPHSVADYPTVSVAARISLDERGLCREARIALGSVGSVPLRARGAERMLAGNKIVPELIRAAADTVGPEVDPISDLRGSADYKRKMAIVFTRRALEQAAARATAQFKGPNSGRPA